MVKQVTIYTTSTCPACKASKEFFKSHNINYTEINVSEDRQKAMEMIDKSGQTGVPVIIVKDGSEKTMFIGYNEVKLKEIFSVR